MGHVLRIGALDDPEELFSISALDKGSLVHGMLDEFIRVVSREGSMPLPGQSWATHHQQILDRIAADHFRQAEAEGKTGRALMWEMEQRNILEDLHRFLEADTALRARFGLSPAHTEARFGLHGSSWPAAELGLGSPGPVRFRGVIDRVDSSTDGKRVLVLDYKTGGASSYRGLKDDPIDKGKHLQLVVYSLAAQNALGPDTEVRAAYWFVSSRGKFDIVPKVPVDISDQNALERFKEGVSIIVSGIKSGLFPANPGQPSWGDFENCSYCDFKPLCPSRKDALWAKKKGNARLISYLELSGGGNALTATFIPQDEAVRERIQESLDESLFVAAGAGTGKTTSLVSRVQSLITSGTATLDRIAIITFTTAAAAELRERIREQLEKAADTSLGDNDDARGPACPRRLGPVLHPDGA